MTALFHGTTGRSISYRLTHVTVSGFESLMYRIRTLDPLRVKRPDAATCLDKRVIGFARMVCALLNAWRMKMRQVARYSILVVALFVAACVTAPQTHAQRRAFEG